MAQKSIFLLLNIIERRKFVKIEKNLIINNVTIGKKRIMEYCFVAESIYIVLKV